MPPKKEREEEGGGGVGERERNKTADEGKQTVHHNINAAIARPYSANVPFIH